MCCVKALHSVTIVMLDDGNPEVWYNVGFRSLCTRGIDPALSAERTLTLYLSFSSKQSHVKLSTERLWCSPFHNEQRMTGRDL